MKRIIAISLALAFLLAVGSVVAYVVLHRETPQAVTVNIDPQDIHNATSNGAIEVKFFEDGVTVKERHIPYADGSQGHQFYRPDGTLRRTTEHYPPARPNAEPTIKAEAEWSDDGKRMVEGRIYRTDESLWTVRKVDSTGKQTEDYFFSDGWHFKTTVSQSGSTGAADITYHQRDGKLWAKENVVLGTYHRVETRWLEVMDSLGTHPVYRVDFLKAGETAGNFTAPEDPSNGSGGYYYYYGYNSTGQLYTLFDSSGRAVARQWYGNRYMYWGHGIDKGLSFVETLNPYNGVAVNRYVVEDGGEEVVLEETHLHDGSVRTYKTYSSFTQKHLLKEFDYYGTKRTRSLVLSDLDSTKLPDGTIVDATEDGIMEKVDHQLFNLPQASEVLEKMKLLSQSEDQTPLGPRDDNDPVKWYRRP